MNRKGFLGSLLAIAVSPTLVKEETDCINIEDAKDFLKIEQDMKANQDFIDRYYADSKVNLRELIPNEKREHLGFVTYREMND